MATKTISLREEAYKRLRAARRHPAESFSDVVMRATWAGDGYSAGEYLLRVRERGPVFAAGDLDRLDAAQLADHPADDKWTARG